MEEAKYKLKQAITTVVLIQISISMVFWLAGWDFNERGESAAIWFSCMLLIIPITMTCPVFWKEEIK